MTNMDQTNATNQRR